MESIVNPRPDIHHRKREAGADIAIGSSYRVVRALRLFYEILTIGPLVPSASTPAREGPVKSDGIYFCPGGTATPPPGP